MSKGAQDHTDDDADVLAIFGISGDLAKKMTFRALYRLEASGKLDCPIVGVAIDEWDDATLRDHAREAIINTVSDPDEEVLKRLEISVQLAAADRARKAQQKKQQGRELGPELKFGKASPL